MDGVDDLFQKQKCVGLSHAQNFQAAFSMFNPFLDTKMDQFALSNYKHTVFFLQPRVIIFLQVFLYFGRFLCGGIENS